MGDKKLFARFNLYFDKGDPAHLEVIGILNRQGLRGKSQYIVNAVQHYENCNRSPDMKAPPRFDEKMIEAVVSNIIQSMGGDRQTKPVKTAPVLGNKDDTPLLSDEAVSFDDAMDELGEDGYNAIMSAMDMFRKE